MIKAHIFLEMLKLLFFPVVAKTTDFQDSTLLRRSEV